MIGFRSNTPWKKIIAICYYSLCFIGFKLGVENGIAILITAQGIPIVVIAVAEGIRDKRFNLLYVIPLYIIVVSTAWLITYKVCNLENNKQTVATAENVAVATATPEVSYNDSELVYVTRGGGKYHKVDCSSIKNSKVYAITVRQAIENSKTECDRCSD